MKKALCFWPVVVLGFLRVLTQAQVKVVSVEPLPSVTGGAGSTSPRFSADGRFLAFVSQAKNLVTNDNKGNRLDIFLRDLTKGTTTLVSADVNGASGGDGNSFDPVMSSNSQFVAFQSTAANLQTNDSNGSSDVFLRDVIGGTTTLVSVSADGTSSGNGASIHPDITPDGRWTAFESAASNLVTNDSNGIVDVFVRDLQTGTTLLASAGAQFHHTNSLSQTPSISADGQRVAFASSAILSDIKSNSLGEIYVHDFTSGTTIWVSHNVYSNFPGSSIESFAPLISADGRFVAFKAASTTTNLYRHDLQTDVTALIGSDVPYAGIPEMSPDGRFIAYESGTSVFLWDSQTGSNALVNVSLAGTGSANGASHTAVMTPDGTKVAFLSDADDLTTAGGNGQMQLYVRDMVAKTTRPISVNLDGIPGTDLGGAVPAISPDGKLVAFGSSDDNLVPNDNNRDSDVFLRNLDTQTTSLISARLNNVPSETGPGFYLLSGNSVGADGRFVALSGSGGALAAGDPSLLQRVLARDLSLGTNILVNQSAIKAIEVSPVISADGRYVAYTEITMLGSNQYSQTYRHDLETSSNWLASLRVDGTGGATGNSTAPSISGDGRRVAFQSDAADLDPADSDARLDVFVHDFDRGTSILVSVTPTGTNNESYDLSTSASPLISRDGRWVVFQSRSALMPTNQSSEYSFRWFARDLVSNTTLLLGDNIGGSAFFGAPVINPASRLVLFTARNNSGWLYDLFAQRATLIFSNEFHPEMSADGRFIVSEARLGTNQFTDILLRDLQNSSTNLVSINLSGSGGGNASSKNPQISYDGRYIVFASRASDLVDNDTNGWADIFVRDRLLNTTILASVNGSGTGPANGPSSKPILGADGRTILFQSFASDLAKNDFNNTRDVFVLRLAAEDSDGDGMDDDWELAYFGTLDRDGGGDFDGDGHTDLDEFLAGTDPTNQGSVLRVLTLSSLSGTTTILWSATPGKSYRGQFKDDLKSSGWTDFPGVVIATASTASQVDNTAVGGHRFYRVMLVP